MRNLHVGCVGLVLLLVGFGTHSRAQADMPAEGQLKLVVDAGSETMFVVGNSARGVSGLQIISPLGGLHEAVTNPALLDFVISSDIQFYAEGAFSGRSLDGIADLSGAYNFQMGAQDLEFKYTDIITSDTYVGLIEYTIPEPSALLLSVLGIFGLCCGRRRA